MAARRLPPTAEALGFLRRFGERWLDGEGRLTVQWRQGDEEKDMLTDYIRAAMRRARYKILPEDGSFYGEIPGLEGVWANADTLEACRDELEDVLEEWIVLSLAKNLPIPTLDGIDLSVSRVP